MLGQRLSLQIAWLGTPPASVIETQTKKLKHKKNSMAILAHEMENPGFTFRHSWIQVFKRCVESASLHLSIGFPPGRLCSQADRPQQVANAVPELLG